jgi:hypothetical protein
LHIDSLPCELRIKFWFSPKVELWNVEHMMNSSHAVARMQIYMLDKL